MKFMLITFSDTEVSGMFCIYVKILSKFPNVFSIIQIQSKRFFLCFVIRNLTTADRLLASVMHSACFEAPKDNHRFVYLL